MPDIPTACVVSRADAVKAIADSMRAREHYIIVVPPAQFSHVASTIVGLPEWVGFIDNGTEQIGRVAEWAALADVELMSRLSTIIGVFLVPKTAPADALARVVLQEIDGSRDILSFQGPSLPYIWPLLFVDAADRVDPGFAASLRAVAIQS